jgi:hypothetical protein
MKVYKIVMIAVISVISVVNGLAQGPLTPPGAPGATMKTLDQVEPRIPIDALPFVIAEAGSYYLVSNLTSTGHGITISNHNVTVDLMGYTISGDNGSSDYGVNIVGSDPAGPRGITVRNGHITGFGDGVNSSNLRGSLLEHLQVNTNSGDGIALHGSSSGNRIVSCDATANGYAGISIHAGDGTFCYGNMVIDCCASQNGLQGIVVGTVNAGAAAIRVERCLALQNGSEGILISSMYNLEGCIVVGSSAVRNGYSGIRIGASSGLGNEVSHCIAFNNTQNGIVCSSPGTRIDGNHVAGHSSTNVGAGFGIQVTSARSLIVRNSCTDNRTNFVLSASSTYGPIVTNTGELATSGAAAHPWANFSF